MHGVSAPSTPSAPSAAPSAPNFFSQGVEKISKKPFHPIVFSTPHTGWWEGQDKEQINLIDEVDGDEVDSSVISLITDLRSRSWSCMIADLKASLSPVSQS